MLPNFQRNPNYIFYCTVLPFVFFNSRIYTAPYCSGGMTLAFWVRLVRGNENRDEYFLIIGQGAEQSNAGIVINVKPYNTELNVYIKLTHNRLKCTFTNIPNDIYRQWFFLSMSFDRTPSTKMVCFMNENRLEVTTYSATANSPSSKFFSGDRGTFMLDDILYLPKFSTDEMIETFYKKSKFLYRVLTT